ncbi:hemolysin family protein [Paenibacillus shunpengii]|uniref:Hemolysin family protein n=1 Tax=Paenibacillus shunpengii TaxID=2054424 RepID=A0ABW5SR16_9BACL|nr:MULTISPECIES: hemolysin family protein [unclassified Paenibacillus]OMC68932.1 transporter associated domain protein [Paenibacillus sp. FSL H7-0326]SDX09379.1 Hemolysin, contains CBS domains [Paenibacillus sp. PDC88]
MDGTIALNLFLVAVFIGLTAFFVGAEFAILKVRMSRIDQLIAEGNKKAVLAKKVAHELDYYLSACQLGITITALVLGALGEPTVEKMLHPVFDSWNLPAALSTVLSYVIALSVVSFLHVVIGELAPKTLAIQFSERMTLLLAGPLYWFGKIMYPVITALNNSARLLLKIFGVKPAGHDTVYSEEELKLIVNNSYESGEINQTELDYLKNIFDFDERILKEIMIPKGKIATFSSDMSLESILEVIHQYEYTRYPVINKGNKEQYLGFINTKEMLTSIAAGREFDLNGFIHPMPSLKETSPIKDVLTKMQQNRVHIALVTDASGQVTGLVTMEDILEEIVGDIHDEYDDIAVNSAPAH